MILTSLHEHASLQALDSINSCLALRFSDAPCCSPGTSHTAIEKCESPDSQVPKHMKCEMNFIRALDERRRVVKEGRTLQAHLYMSQCMHCSQRSWVLPAQAHPNPDASRNYYEGCKLEVTTSGMRLMHCWWQQAQAPRAKAEERRYQQYQREKYNGEPDRNSSSIYDSSTQVYTCY